MESIVVNACVCCSSRLRIDPCLILDTLESATCRTSGTQPSERQYSETGVLRRPTVTQYIGILMISPCGRKLYPGNRVSLLCRQPGRRSTRHIHWALSHFVDHSDYECRCPAVLSDAQGRGGQASDESYESLRIGGAWRLSREFCISPPPYNH